MLRYLVVLVLVSIVIDCDAAAKRKHIPRGKPKTGPRQGWGTDSTDQAESCCDDTDDGWENAEQNNGGDDSQNEWAGDPGTDDSGKTEDAGWESPDSSSDTGDSGGWGSPDDTPTGGDDTPPGGDEIPPEAGRENDDDIPDCTCVEFYLCDEQYRVITDGTGMVNWRSGVQECADTEVCCTKPKSAEESQPPTLPESPGEEMPLSSCGESHPNPEVLPASGEEEGATQFDEFPWMLQLKNANDDAVSSGLEEFKCGATLIAANVALTAAHCLKDELTGEYKISAENLIVRAGEWDIQSDYEPTPYEDRHVEKIHIHPQFSSKHPKNDIAIIVLKEPYQLSRHVNTICLPESQDLDLERCVATGWGNLNDKPQHLMRKVEMPVVSNKECQSALRQSRLGKYFLLHPSFMCAGGREGEDVCVGDGGGPLICPVRNSQAYVQLGVVSWGIDCGKAGRPGVYADIRVLLPWVNEKLQGL